MTANHTCNCCASETQPLLSLGDHPIANNLAASASEAVVRYPMNVAGCTTCGLVQLSMPIDASMFYTDYATPSNWKPEPHIDKLVSALRTILPSESRVLDIGCNDGKFMRQMIMEGWERVTGLEPSGNTAAAAVEQGLSVLNESLSLEVADRLVEEHGVWDCLSLRQVLEHIVNLDDFGRALNRLLSMGGILAIEVPDSRLNFSGRDYALWEEHVNYFTPETLQGFLVFHGFEVMSSYESQFSGICHTVISQKVSEPLGSAAQKCFLTPGQLGAQVSAFRAWADGFAAFKSTVGAEIEERKSLGQLVLYGVGSRSSNFINIMDLAPFVSFAVDDQPQKQDRFMPGSGIPILSSAQAESSIQQNTFFLLGVNGENEESLIKNSPILSGHSFASVLPPSRHLLRTWAVG